MKGVWLDGKRGCLDRRPLRVSIQIDLVSPAGKTTRIKRSRQATVDNCAEGGPNFGFDLAPKAYKMACANGRWKPGRYSLTTRTLDLRSGISAQASLYHQITEVLVAIWPRSGLPGAARWAALLRKPRARNR